MLATSGPVLASAPVEFPPEARAPSSPFLTSYKAGDLPKSCRRHEVTGNEVISLIERAFTQNEAITVTPSQRWPKDSRLASFKIVLTYSTIGPELRSETTLYHVEIPLASPLDKALARLLRTKGTTVKELHQPGLEDPTPDSPRTRRRSSSFSITREAPLVAGQDD